MNNLGQATGSAYGITTSQEDFKPYRWTPRAGLVLLNGSSGTAVGNDINDAGEVVGQAVFNFRDGVRAIRGMGATYVSLGILPDASNEGSSRAFAINSSGQVVGASVAPGYFTHAVLWSADNVIQDLGTLGGSNSAASDINESGSVIGTSAISGDAETHFFLWSAAGGMRDLTAQLGALKSLAAINDAGQIAGSFTNASGQTHAFLYSPGSGLKDLGTLGGTSSTATGLNNKGQVVGNSTLANGTVHDFLWTPSDGLEDVTATTGITGARLLNDNLQTVTGPTNFNSASGAIRVIKLEVVPNEAPVARFTWSCVELTCTFDASGSSDDKSIARYEWDFNKYPDGTGEGAKVLAVYPHPDTRQVRLTVTDGNGLSNSVTQAVTFGSAPVNKPPVASFTASCDGLTCTLDASASTDDKGVVSYAWDLNKYPDRTATGKIVVATYPHADTRNVTLTVTDAEGLTNTVTKAITFGGSTPPDAAPVARFTWSCPTLTCSFDASTSSDDVGIVSYAWSLDKYPGGSATGVTTSGDYPHSGTRNVTLTVTDTKGQTSSVTQQITIP